MLLGPSCYRLINPSSVALDVSVKSVSFVLSPILLKRLLRLWTLSTGLSVLVNHILGIPRCGPGANTLSL
jgi:hypothetical protein